MLGEQNPLSVLSDKVVCTMLQKSIVPWLVAIFCVDYPTQITANIVRQIISKVGVHINARYAI